MLTPFQAAALVLFFCRFFLSSLLGVKITVGEHYGHVGASRAAVAADGSSPITSPGADAGCRGGVGRRAVQFPRAIDVTPEASSLGLGRVIG